MCNKDCKNCQDKEYAPDRVVAGEGYVVFDEFLEKDALYLTSDFEGMDVVKLNIPIPVTGANVKYRLILEKVNED
jgi:hypothetical protein